jgi:hypothetical protein
MQVTRSLFDAEDYSSCVHNLLIISQIRERDRLRTNNGFLVDSADTHFQSVHRWLQSESRTTMLTALNILYESATHLCRMVIQTRDMYELNTVEHIRLRMQANMLYDCISRSTLGLVNLKTTYRQDRTVCMRLEMIINNVFNELELLEHVNTESYKKVTAISSPVVCSVNSSPIFQPQRHLQQQQQQLQQHSPIEQIPINEDARHVQEDLQTPGSDE